MEKVLYTNEMLQPESDGYHFTMHTSLVAKIKRVLEYYTLDPNFVEMWKNDSQKALQEIGIDLDANRIRRLLDPKYDKDPISEEICCYQEFVKNKLKSRCYMQQEGSVPKNTKVARWRERQVKRCWVEMGMRNQSLIHAPLMFELSDGCSVGCPFCGLNAGKLKKVYRYTEENAQLFRQILMYMKELLGQSVGVGTCYYATEPLDNPDYEQFILDYYEILHVIPQITTAVSMRNPERTRRMLSLFQQKYYHIHRFSVLSLDVFHEIMKSFTPEELLYVELLPQFTEAPSNHFSSVGRNRQADDKTQEYHTGTICCISGFVVNLARKEVRLVSPCGVDEQHPTGERIFDVKYFENIEDFKSVIREMIRLYMGDIDYKRKYSFYPYLHIQEFLEEEGIEFDQSKNYKILQADKNSTYVVLPYEGGQEALQIFYKELNRLFEKNQQIIKPECELRLIQNTSDTDYLVIPFCPALYTEEERMKLTKADGTCTVESDVAAIAEQTVVMASTVVEAAEAATTLFVVVEGFIVVI